MKALQVIRVLLYVLFFMSCSKEPTESKDPVAEWTTIFFDDFKIEVKD